MLWFDGSVWTARRELRIIKENPRGFPEDREGRLGSLERRFLWLWIVAVLFAVGNALVVVRRMPIQRQLANNADEAAARQAARWIAALPSGEESLILLSHRDETAFWFGCRITYYASPHRVTLVWLPMPKGLVSPASTLIAFRSAQGAVPAGWSVRQQTGEALLATRSGTPGVSARIVSSSAFASPLSRFPRLVRAGIGLWGLASIPLLGALLLGVTLRSSPFPEWWANLAVAHLVGAAALAWMLQLEAMVGQTPGVWPVYVVLLLLIPTWRRAQERIFPVGEAKASVEARPTIGEWALCAVVALGVVTALERGLLIGLDWDGFMIWQLKAKTFFLDGNLSLLREPTHFPYAHLDYPLLVPFQSWWLYTHFGAANPRWAQMSGLLFYADTLLLFAAATRHRVPRVVRLLGLGVLSCLPEVTMHAVSGYADLPLAAYFLALAICLMRMVSTADFAVAPWMAWMLAGAVLTKNEGLLACVSALALAAIILLQRGRLRTEGKWLALWGSAALVAYMPWWWLKRQWNLVSDLFQPEQAPRFTPPLLWWRFHYALLNGFGGELLHIGPWFPAWGLVALVLPLGFVASLWRRVAICSPLWGMCGVQLLGYVGIYMITPASLPAHIGSSVERLILHMLPTLLVAALLGCFTPASGTKT